jgi:hypothetical protein
LHLPKKAVVPAFFVRYFRAALFCTISISRRFWWVSTTSNLSDVNGLYLRFINYLSLRR